MRHTGFVASFKTWVGHPYLAYLLQQRHRTWYLYQVLGTWYGNVQVPGIVPGTWYTTRSTESKVRTHDSLHSSMVAF